MGVWSFPLRRVDMTIEMKSTQNNVRQRITILSGLLVIAMLIGFFQWRALGSVEDTYAVAQEQLLHMQIDASRIHALMETPQAATNRARTQQELLGQVEQSLTVAGIDRSLWHDSIPQPPIRIADSDYRQLTTRLYFKDLTMKKTASFIHHLESNDPTLSVTALNLINRHSGSVFYDIDLAVTYLVYLPSNTGQ